jgi:hypothetical protein
MPSLPGPLTTPPFRPKLMHTKEMTINRRNIGLLALLLALILFAAQLHICADLTSAPTGTHLCSVCSAVGAAIVTPSPSITIISQVGPLEVLAHTVVSSLEIPRATAPRAPPAI